MKALRCSAFYLITKLRFDLEIQKLEAVAMFSGRFLGSTKICWGLLFLNMSVRLTLHICVSWSEPTFLGLLLPGHQAHYSSQCAVRETEALTDTSSQSPWSPSGCFSCLEILLNSLSQPIAVF